MGAYEDLVFDRYQVADIESVAPILRGRGSVIYILEFENGDRYVGQAINFVRRFAQHRHGSRHHSPWEDITAVQVAGVLTTDLSDAERAIIDRERRTGHHLRNRVYNIDNDLPSTFDIEMPVHEQEHWATGHGSFDRGSFSAAAIRATPGTTRLMSSRSGKVVIADGRTIADAVLDDLAVVIANTIPNAVQLEGDYWTLSDYPSTYRGRYATLNVGYLELLYFPRHPLDMIFENDETVVVEHAAVLNLPVGTMSEPGDQSGDGYSFEWPTGTCFAWFNIDRPGNRGKPSMGTRTDQIVMPIGTLSADFEAVDLLEPIRELALKLMRRSSARIYAKSHSTELARLAYERITRTDR